MTGFQAHLREHKGARHLNFKEPDMVRIVMSMLAAAVVLGACAESTPYQRAGADSRFGFSEQQIESNRYMVQFAGNSLTDRQAVETFLLYRAAELTLEQGYDHFTIVRRDTDADRRLTGTVGSPFRSSYGFNYRYYHPRFGWYGWRDPFWDDVNVREITQYHAMAEIQMGCGAREGDPNTFNAGEVVRNLGPNVRPPVG
jgi:hypothetical protein